MPKIDGIADSSYLYALFNLSDPDHELCFVTAQVYPKILLPDVVLTEVAYLFNRAGGSYAVAAFLKALLQAELRLVRVTRLDLERAAEILELYRMRGTELDFVDCCVVAIAERYKTDRVFTLDHRDFSIIATRRGFLKILPD